MHGQLWEEKNWPSSAATLRPLLLELQLLLIMLLLEGLYQASNIQAATLEEQGKRFRALVICTRRLVAEMTCSPSASPFVSPSHLSQHSTYLWFQIFHTEAARDLDTPLLCPPGRCRILMSSFHLPAWKLTASRPAPEQVADPA